MTKHLVQGDLLQQLAAPDTSKHLFPTCPVSSPSAVVAIVSAEGGEMQAAAQGMCSQSRVGLDTTATACHASSTQRHFRLPEVCYFQEFNIICGLLRRGGCAANRARHRRAKRMCGRVPNSHSHPPQAL